MQSDFGRLARALLASLQRKMANKLVLAHHFLLLRFVGFTADALGLITADKHLHGGTNEVTIRKLFIRCVILLNVAGEVYLQSAAQ